MSKWRNLQSLEGCGNGPCGLPPGFFRLRYFHGKQMRLADYEDEQLYHRSKMRLHNGKLHGAGILCGLKVSLLEPDGVALRVSRGAALDDCGREIVVGYDQCVDVDSWFKKQKRVVRDGNHDPCKPNKENKIRICVVIAYAECAGVPEPAPKSPCAPPSGCDCDCGTTTCPDPCGDGAEFGRVTEEFELGLMFWEDAKRLTEHEFFPTAEEIDAAVAASSGGVGLLKSLAKPIRTRCPGSDERWLLLACFDAVLDGDDAVKVTAIENIDHEYASQVLLSTEVIQYLLAGLFAEVDPDIGGPEIANIRFGKRDDKTHYQTHYQFVLTLTDTIDKASLDVDSSFDLRHLMSNGWRTPASNAVKIDYAESANRDHSVDGPAIYVTVDNSADFLKPGGRYQLFTPPVAEPVVDDQLRQLRPRNLAWRFEITTDENGELCMVPLPHAPYASE